MERHTLIVGGSMSWVGILKVIKEPSAVSSSVHHPLSPDTGCRETNQPSQAPAAGLPYHDGPDPGTMNQRNPFLLDVFVPTRKVRQYVYSSIGTCCVSVQQFKK